MEVVGEQPGADADAGGGGGVDELMDNQLLDDEKDSDTDHGYDEIVGEAVDGAFGGPVQAHDPALRLQRLGEINKRLDVS